MKKVYSAEWITAYATGAAEPVQGSYGVKGHGRSRSLLRAIQAAKRDARRKMAEVEKTVSDELAAYVQPVLDDGHAEIKGDLSQYWSIMFGRVERHTRSRELVARIKARK